MGAGRLHRFTTVHNEGRSSPLFNSPPKGRQVAFGCGSWSLGGWASLFSVPGAGALLGGWVRRSTFAMPCTALCAVPAPVGMCTEVCAQATFQRLSAALCTGRCKRSAYISSLFPAAMSSDYPPRGGGIKGGGRPLAPAPSRQLCRDKRRRCGEGIKCTFVLLRCTMSGGHPPSLILPPRGDRLLLAAGAGAWAVGLRFFLHRAQVRCLVGGCDGALSLCPALYSAQSLLR